MVAGNTRTFGATGADLWVLKLNSAGDVVWQRSYDSGSDERRTDVVQTSDGGYVAVSSADPGLPGFPKRFWVLKLKPDGSISSTCPATIGANTSVVPQSASGSVQNTTTTPQASSAVVVTPGATVINTNATVETVCSGT